ncbi:MAG: PQQ-binding-like beta-propeller repeat protein [Methanocorpusculum sp.]|nr:PQQ-binding-like beta-propeller repeat protein [Methanocorpusculum sp.]MDE2525448.1 PQQ-binding-like beta-propeller repeat protein [Methanocorpusculum sp.]
MLADAGAIEGPPAVDGMQVFYGTRGGIYEGVYCVDLSSQNIIWNTTISGGTVSGITVSDTNLYLGGTDGCLYCLEKSTGKILFKTDSIDSTSATILGESKVVGLSSTPLVVDGTVYVTTQTPAKLWAFSKELTPNYNISLEVERVANTSEFASPVHHNGKIYTSGGPGLVVVDPSSKTITATFRTDGAAGTPVIAENTLYITTKTTSYAVSIADTLTEKWTKEKDWVGTKPELATYASASTPAVHNGTIVINEVSRYAAYSTENPTQKWEYTPDKATATSPNSPVIVSVDPITARTEQNNKVSTNKEVFSDVVFCTFLYSNEHASSIDGVNLETGNTPWDPLPTTKPKIFRLYGTGKSNQAYTENLWITTSTPAIVANNELSYGAFVIGTASPASMNPVEGYSNSLLILGSSRITILKADSIDAVPSQYGTTIDNTFVPGNTLLGALTQGKIPFTASKSAGLTMIKDVSASGEDAWYIQTNDGSITKADWHNVTSQFNAEAKITCYLSTDAILSGDRSGLTNLYTLTIKKVSDTKGTFVLSDTYTRAVVPGTEYTISIHATDWQGNDIENPQASWTADSNINVIGSTTGPSVNYSLHSGTGKITVSYTAENSNNLISYTNTTEYIYISSKDVIPPVNLPTTYLTWRGDYTHAGVLDTTGPKTSDMLWNVTFSRVPTADPNTEETSYFCSLVDGSPVINNDRIYFTVWDGGMPPEPVQIGTYCYNLDGTFVWHSDVLSSRSPLTIADGKIYGGGLDGRLYCLKESDGSLIWKSSIIGSYPYQGLTSSPVVYNGKIYVATGKGNAEFMDNKLYVFNAENTGSDVQPETVINGNGPKGESGGINMYSSPSLSPNGVMYVPGSGGVYAIDTRTHSKLWTYDVGAYGPDSADKKQFVGTPVYKDQRIYFLTTTGLHCIYAINGTKIWSNSSITSSPYAPAVTDDKILVLGYGLTAYDLNGNFLWQTLDRSAAGRAAPIVADGVAYYGTSTAGTIFAVDITTGNELWHYTLPRLVVQGWDNYIEATPAVYNGVLYVGSEEGRFYAFGPTDKTQFSITGTSTVDTGVEAVFTTDTGRAYNWDFGDGTKTTGTATVVKKIWKTAGTYTVTASSGSNKATCTVTVTTPPKAFSESEAHNNPASVTTATIEVMTPTPTPTPTGPAPAPTPNITTEPGTNVSLTFSTKVLESSAGTAPAVTVQVAEYQAVTAPDAKITLDETKYTVPPNTEKTIFLMNVSTVQNVKQIDTVQGHRLDVMAKLVVNLTVTTETASKVNFWRYIDGNTNPIPLESWAPHIPDTSGPIVVEYIIYVPGFSTIVATVDKTSVTPIDPPKENTGGGGGGSSSGSSYSGLSFTNVNPGTGDFEYTTTDGTTYTVSGMTAFGVLNAAGLTLETKTWPGGIYVNAINGLAQDANLNGWMYQVNGYAPMVMSNNYKVTYGDKVVWYYSDSEMSTDPAKSKKYYAFTVSTAVSATGGGASGQTIGQTAKPGTTTSIVVPAETKQIAVTIPDGISVEKLAVGQKITIDTAVTKLTGTVNVNSRSIVIIQPGIQITIPLADVVYNGDVATATIRGMTAEIVPVPVTVPKGGYSL